jgi:hypothetical protein
VTAAVEERGFVADAIRDRSLYADVDENTLTADVEEG